MTDTNHLSGLWEHTIVTVFKHYSKSQLGLMLKQWIIFNKLENFNSILNYTIDDFTPSGNLCYMNEHGDILPYTPMKKIFNLKWYIQYLIDESEDEDQTPLSEENWMKQNNCKLMKYVIHHRHPMTPEQLKQNPFEEIFKNQNKELDTEKGELNTDEQESTISIKEEDEYSTFSDMSKQDSDWEGNMKHEKDHEKRVVLEDIPSDDTMTPSLALCEKEQVAVSSYFVEQDEDINATYGFEDEHQL